MALKQELLNTGSSEEEAMHQINKIHRIETANKRNFTRLAVNYSLEEGQKILEAAEKDCFLIYQKDILDPKQPVMRAIYPKENMVLIKFSAINDTDAKNIQRGSWLLTQTSPNVWRLFRKDAIKLQELEISEYNGLQTALDSLPNNKSSEESYTNDEMMHIKKILPLCPVDIEHGVLGREEEFFCLSPAQVTLARNSSLYRTTDYRGVIVGIDLMWVDKLQADEFLGKKNKLSECPYEISRLSDKQIKSCKKSISENRSFANRESYIRSRAEDIYKEIKKQYPNTFKQATRVHVALLLENEEKTLYDELKKRKPAQGSYKKYISAQK